MIRLAALTPALFLLACAPAQVTVVMNAQNNSGQSGTATLTDLGGTTRVVILIRQSEFGEKQPVHLHNGRCGEIGPRQDVSSRNKTIGLASMEPANPATMTGVPATDGGFAGSSSEVDLTIKEITDGDWVINVHDALDFSLYVSCGNIN
jgi:hypothetical protein